MDKIIIYTDGSCLRNGFQDSWGGWAYKMFLPKRKTREMAGAVKGRTNNEMEMLAVIHALRDIKDKNVQVEIRTDSNYIVMTVAGFYGIHANRHLWAQLFAEKAKLSAVYFTWVKAHDKDWNNNRVDRMARQAAEFMASQEDKKNGKLS